MAVKSSIAQFSYAKALIVFALVPWRAASGAAAESRPEDVTSQALSAAHTPVLIKRMLRSHAVMTVTDHTSTPEERLTCLNDILLKLKETLQMWWWRPTKMFEDTIIPESNKFFATVELMHGKETATILTSLNEEFTDAHLAYMIYKAIQSDKMQPLMVDLRDAQFVKWLAQETTPEKVKIILQRGIESDSDPVLKIVDRIAQQYQTFYGKKKIAMGDPGTSGNVHRN